MKTEVVNNIFWREETVNSNFDESDRPSHLAVANSHQTVIDVDKEKAIIKQRTLKIEMEML